MSLRKETAWIIGILPDSVTRAISPPIFGPFTAMMTWNNVLDKALPIYLEDVISYPQRNQITHAFVYGAKFSVNEGI